MKYLRFIFFPFSLLYGFILVVRNTLYDYNVVTSSKFDLPLITVGNLTAGGTGKTPHIAYLSYLFQTFNIQNAILSRGYRRKTAGYVLAEPTITANEIGDEPMQLYLQTGVPVAVCENRVIGTSQLLFDAPQTQVVLLDDAYQHRAITAGFNILLTTYQNPFYNDYLLPVGMLREYRAGYKRANAIVVTKCPDNLSSIQQQQIIKKINPLPHQHVFFSTFKYGQIYNLATKQPNLADKDTFVYFFAGIAQTDSVDDYLKTRFNDYFIRKYADHVNYNQSTIQNLIKDFNTVSSTKKILLTTEKDAVKLFEPTVQQWLNGYQVFVLPVWVKFIDEHNFNDLMLNYVKQN